MPAQTARRDGSRAPRCKTTVLPTVRPTPPPPPEKTPPKPEYRCNSGEGCPAHAELGHPEKIRVKKGKKGYCDRCLSRRAERTTASLEARRAGGAPRTATA